MKDHVIKLGVPKGSLERATIDLFAQGGMEDLRLRAVLFSFHR